MHSLAEAIDLYGLGVELMRQNLRRAHPEWSDGEVQSALSDWLLERPGAEHGDCAPGIVRTWEQWRQRQG